MSAPPVLVTLDRSHPDFEKYIWGTFSKTHRAIATESLNVNTDQERVTFEIRPIETISMPGFFKRWYLIFKFQNFLLVVLPLALVFVKNFISNNIDEPILAGFSAAGALLLYAAVSLASDVQDHVRGLDRILPQNQNQALPGGWVTAHKLRKLSYMLLAGAVIMGSPALVSFPEILWTILPLAALGVVGLISYKAGLKYRTWSEWVVFLMLGPLLTVGYQLAMGADLDVGVIFIGVLTGWLAVFLLHLKNWHHMMVHSQARLNNTVARFGFEKSKKFIIIWWMLFVVLFVLYQVIYTNDEWLWMMTAMVVFCSIPVLAALSEVESPLGSKLHRAYLVGNRMAYFVMAFWLLQSFWSALAYELSF